MRLFITILLSFIVNSVYAQYPVVENFTGVNGVGEWTTDYGGFIETYGGVDHLSFADWPAPYSNSTTHTATSPTYDLSNCATDIEVSFPFAGLVEDGFDYLYFDYFDGGVWVNDVSYTGSQNVTYTNSAIPNTTTQFRFRLVTNAVDPEYLNRWYADNLNGSWGATQTAQRNTRIDRSTQYIGFRGGPKTVSGYYYDIASFTISCASILPIELISFSGERVGNSIQLEWTTGSEVNNDFFEIERSYNGVEWMTVGKVYGNGTTSFMSEYTHTDYLSYWGNVYYRLKQVDYDGRFDYHMIIIVKGSSIKPDDEGDYINVLNQKVPNEYKGYKIKKKL